MPKLAYSNQITRQQPIRTRPAKYATSPIRPPLEQGDAGGIRPKGAFYAYKYLPVMFKDVETEDYIVILKGRAVGLITNQVPTEAGANTGISGGIPDVTSSGTILAFDSATTAAATYTAVNIDSSYFGYHDSAAGLLIPANGGVAGAYTYAAIDVTAGVTKPDTTLIVQSGDTISIPSNYPVGFAPMDVMQDIRGRHLNYDLWHGIYGVVADGLIVVPYVDYGDTTPQSTATFAAAKIDDYVIHATNDAGYDAVYKTHTFFYFDSTADRMAGQAGKILTTDTFGNYVAQGTEASMVYTTAATEQTVGRVFYTDARYPKGGLEGVDTYYGSGLTGTETAGISYLVYNFAKDAMTGMSLNTSITEVADMVQAGVFGAAYLQIDVA